MGAEGHRQRWGILRGRVAGGLSPVIQRSRRRGVLRAGRAGALVWACSAARSVRRGGADVPSPCRDGTPFGWVSRTSPDVPRMKKPGNFVRWDGRHPWCAAQGTGARRCVGTRAGENTGGEGPMEIAVAFVFRHATPAGRSQIDDGPLSGTGTSFQNCAW